MLVTGVRVWKHILVNAGAMVWQQNRRQRRQDILYLYITSYNRTVWKMCLLLHNYYNT